ncbi:MAG: FecR domain-containing protein [Burkholderiales bacterium]|nr:FecR domain-containing protein [Burkholderiales bacterium]MBK8665372.1 FecR domain-containing protein [Burkholderiales bacterium]
MRVQFAQLLRAAAGIGLLCGAAVFAQAPAATPAAAPVPPAAADAREGTFKTVQGDVTVVRGNVRSAAVVGDGLRIADRVLTGDASAAAITLKDGTVLSIGAGSSVDLAEFQFNPTTHDGHVLISLLRGSLRVVTGLIAKLKPEQVKVTTPTTVIGVRGTDFIVEQR